jgi:hypothetical protein
MAAAAVAATFSVAALLCSLPRCSLLVHSPLRQAVAVEVGDDAWAGLVKLDALGQIGATPLLAVRHDQPRAGGGH